MTAMGRTRSSPPTLRRDARSFDGTVERHGALTLLWVHGDESRLAERVRDCLL
jgi:hypothetical protein